MPNQTLSEAWISFLAPLPLPWFLTQTFAKPQHPENVLKAQRYFAHVTSKELLGNHYKRKGEIPVQFVAAIERHKSGLPHGHALFGHPAIDLTLREFRPLMTAMKEFSDEQWGHSRLELVTAAESAKGYVTKYATKFGEIHFSDRLGEMFCEHQTRLEFQPERLRDVRRRGNGGAACNPA